MCNLNQKDLDAALEVKIEETEKREIKCECPYIGRHTREGPHNIKPFVKCETHNLILCAGCGTGNGPNPGPVADYCCVRAVVYGGRRDRDKVELCSIRFI